MGRPVYPYELVDPDFCWLISNFQETFPEYRSVESPTLPVVFISFEPDEDVVSPSKSDTHSDAASMVAKK